MTREQFISYVESTQDALRRFLVALCCGDAALADDLAQETYIKAYLSADTFREESRFTTWLYRIACNTFVSDRRSRRISEPVESHENSLCADSGTDEAFRYQALYAAMAQLSEKERTAIVLYYLQGYQIKEICQITGAKDDAVKQQLSRGRLHLKKLLLSPNL